MSQGPPTSSGGEGQQPQQPQQPVTPPGWYPHPSAPGWEAYWDGQAWGTETRPAATPQASPEPTYGEPQQAAPAQQPQQQAQAHQQVVSAERQPAAAQPVPAAVPPGGEQSSSLPPIVCVLGAVVAIVGCFLPVASSSSIAEIADNTLIAAGYGYAAIVAALLGAGAAVYYYVKGGRSWLPIILGAVVLAIAAYAGTIGLDPVPAAGTTQVITDPGGSVDEGSPSTGVFLTAIGGILIILGGLGISREPK